jgi:hypothetical protein
MATGARQRLNRADCAKAKRGLRSHAGVRLRGRAGVADGAAAGVAMAGVAMAGVAMAGVAMAGACSLAGRGASSSAGAATADEDASPGTAAA